MPRAALFDLDGTLVDSAGGIAAALNRLMTAAGRAAFPRPEVERMIGDGAEVLVRRACAARDLAYGPALLADFLNDEALGDEGAPVFDGVLEVLSALRDAGWRLGVCTNKPERLAVRLLDGLGLSPLLDGIGGGPFPVRKPDPAHPLGVLARMGCPRDGAVLVGDHANDVLAARGAGIEPIFAAWGYGPPDMADGARVAGAPGDLPGLLGPA
ncbi:HAD family hydrolase [Roseomonas sp. CCTCC AB2023176]|uniref:HAD family hydrolase n=1 Tax=Roseomonas sp. CCTCC AB2023176 TaxID=3342640 RepID=UPI0035E29306